MPRVLWDDDIRAGRRKGEEITLSANGDDEEAAMTSIEKYLSNNQ